MRQSYYDLEENKAAKFQVFRFAKRSVNTDKPIFNLAIVNNFLKDEAYLLLEPNQSTGDIPYKIISTNDSTKVSRTILLAAQNRETTLNFAADIYDDIKLENQLQLSIGDTLIDILDNHQEREAFRITVSDYLRLTRVFKKLAPKRYVLTFWIVTLLLTVHIEHPTLSGIITHTSYIGPIKPNTAWIVINESVFEPGCPPSPIDFKVMHQITRDNLTTSV